MHKAAKSENGFGFHVNNTIGRYIYKLMKQQMFQYKLNKYRRQIYYSNRLTVTYVVFFITTVCATVYGRCITYLIQADSCCVVQQCSFFFWDCCESSFGHLCLISFYNTLIFNKLESCMQHASDKHMDIRLDRVLL